jgi:uncharacterized oxidoreductase
MELTPGQSCAPNALPLEDYLNETMLLLETSPQTTEILVERVTQQRLAERNRSQEVFFKRFNDTLAALAD